MSGCDRIGRRRESGGHWHSPTSIATFEPLESRLLMDGSAAYDAEAGGGPSAAYEVAAPGDTVIDLDDSGKASFYDSGGNLVRVTLKGPGGGSLYFSGPGPSDANHLVLDGTSLKSSLTILTAGSQIRTTLGDITINGSLGKLTARTTDLIGDLTATQWVRTLRLADVAGPHTIRMGPSVDVAGGAVMTFGRVAELSIESAVTIRSITATEWLDVDGTPDVIEAPSIGKLNVRGDRRSAIDGDFQADLVLDGPDDGPQGLTGAQVRGSLTGADWEIIGDVGRIVVAGAVDGWTLDVRGELRQLTLGDVAGADVMVDGDIGAVRAQQWLTGSVQAATLRSLAVRGDRRAGLAGNFGATLTLTHARAGGTSGLDSSNVLVIYNADSPEGSQIASYYAQMYPGVQTLALHDVPVAEDAPADVYIDEIRPQVLGALTDSIDCIVTTKGLPLRIDNPVSDPPIWWNRYSSLEAELARIDSIDSTAAMGDQGILNPQALNPYYTQDQRFAYTTYGTRLVTRLDGFTVADVEAGIARARAAVIGRPGSSDFVVDDHPDLYDRMELLRDDVLAPSGRPYLYDGTQGFLREAPGSVIGYVGHGVHGGLTENYVRDPDYGLAFSIAPGGIFHTWESYSAYTFEGDNDTASPRGQGLVAQWIARGGTAGIGHVEEPRANSMGVANEDVFFGKLLEGYTWAEAAWNATFQLSFVNTVIGDPLMVWRQWSDGDRNGPSQTLGSARISGNLGDANWDITGDAGRISVAGQVDGWTLDVQGALGQLALSDVAAADVTVDGAVGAVRACQWLTGNLQADALQSLSVRGDRRTGLVGNFGATLTLSDAQPGQTLGSATISGGLIGSHWDISGDVGRLRVNGTARNSTVRSTGSILGIRLGATESSRFLAGVSEVVSDHATAADDFVNPLAEIRSIEIAGLRSTDGEPVPRFFFTDTDFSAGLFGTVNLLNVDFGSQEQSIHVLGSAAAIRSVRWRDTVTQDTGVWSGTQDGLPDFVNVLQ